MVDLPLLNQAGCTSGRRIVYQASTRASIRIRSDCARDQGLICRTMSQVPISQATAVQAQRRKISGHRLCIVAVDSNALPACGVDMLAQ